MNDDLRNSIWNVIFQILEVHKNYEGHLDGAVKVVAKDFLKKPLDEVPYSHTDQLRWLKAVYKDLDWHEVYDLVEFLERVCVRRSEW